MPTDRVKIEVLGVPELSRVLRTLGQTAGNRIARKVVRAASTPMLKDARSKAPKRTGKLAKGIRRRIVSKRGKDGASARITAAPGEAINPSWVEFGTQPRRTKSGKSTGTMPAKPFLRPAFDANQAQAERTAAQVFGQELDREAARAAARRNKNR